MTDEERLQIIESQGVLDENAQDGYINPSDGWSVDVKKNAEPNSVANTPAEQPREATETPAIVEAMGQSRRTIRKYRFKQSSEFGYCGILIAIAIAGVVLFGVGFLSYELFAKDMTTVMSSKNEVKSVVVHVIDDTMLTVLPSGAKNPVTVRLAGIDVPRTLKGTDGKSERILTKFLSDGDSVKLESGTWSRDAAGRLNVYVRKGDVFVNLKMIEDGYAVPGSIHPNEEYRKMFMEAYNAAAKVRERLFPPEPTPTPRPRVNFFKNDKPSTKISINTGKNVKIVRKPTQKETGKAKPATVKNGKSKPQEPAKKEPPSKKGRKK